MSGGSLDSAQAVESNRAASYSNGHSVFVDGTETVKLLNQSQINSLITDSFTWAFWYRDTSISTGDLGGFKLDNSPSQAIRIRPVPVAPGVQFLQSIVQFNGVSTSATDSIGTALANNTWHHIAMVVTKGSGGANPGNVKVYIDGSQVSNFTGPVTTNQEAAAVQGDTTWGVGSAIEDDGAEAVSSRLTLMKWLFGTRPYLLTISERFTTAETVHSILPQTLGHTTALQICSTTLGLRTITQTPKEMLLTPQQKEALCLAHHQHHLDHEEVRYRKQVRAGRLRVYNRLFSAVILKQVSPEVQP